MDDNNLQLHERFKLLVNNIESLEKETLSFANAKKDLIDTNNDFRELLFSIKELNSSANELLDEAKKVLSKDIIIKYDEMISLFNNKLAELNLVVKEMKRRNTFNTLIIIIGIIVIIAIEVLFKLF